MDNQPPSPSMEASPKISNCETRGMHKAMGRVQMWVREEWRVAKSVRRSITVSRLRVNRVLCQKEAARVDLPAAAVARRRSLSAYCRDNV